MNRCTENNIQDTHCLAVLFPLHPGEPKPDLYFAYKSNGLGAVATNFSACTDIIADLANADFNDISAMTKACQMLQWFDVVSESNPDAQSPS